MISAQWMQVFMLLLSLWVGSQAVEDTCPESLQLLQGALSMHKATIVAGVTKINASEAAKPERKATKIEAHATEAGKSTKPSESTGKQSKESTGKQSKEPASSSHHLPLSEFTMNSFEPLIKISLCLAIVAAIVFEITLYMWSDTNPSPKLESGEESQESDLMRLFAGVRPLISPYFCNPESNCSWMYVAALFTLGCVELLFVMLWTKCQQEFWNALQTRDQQGFIRRLLDFAMLTVAWTVVSAYGVYVQMMMSVHWRKFMTDLFLRKWFRAKVFYHLQMKVGPGSWLDNPDQRIQVDINTFIGDTLRLTGNLLGSLGRTISMLPVLFFVAPPYAFGVFYCPGWMVILSVLYSSVGTLLIHKIGGHLIIINFAIQKYEANFRYSVVQVRDHAESIALYGSEDVEQMRMQETFGCVIRTWWSLMKYTKRLSFFSSFYDHVSGFFPMFALAPNFFKGQLTLGNFMVLLTAHSYVKGSFDWIIANYGPITNYRSTVDRLSNFWYAVHGGLEEASMAEMLLNKPARSTEEDAAARIAEDASGNQPSEDAVVAKDICVMLPGKDSKKLWNKANLSVKPGQFILLSAPEGSGKSCFFRALAGIWPHTTGSVTMKDQSLFLPQRSFIPQGTLKEAVAYPEKPDKYTDEEVRNALDIVQLDVLKDRDLSENANWETLLSGGEQQKLAIAHAVLKRPEVLFMDEATTAMSDQSAREVYSLLRRKGTLADGAAVISISHNHRLLEPFHDAHFEYDPTMLNWRPVTK